MLENLVDIATFSSLAISIWTLKAIQSVRKPRYKVFSHEKIKKKKKISLIYIKEQLKFLVGEYQKIFRTKQKGLEEGINHFEDMPNGWRVIICEGKVIGFWVLYCMDENTYKKMKKRSFTARINHYLWEGDEKSHQYGYLWMIGIAPEHMTYYGMKAMCKGFLNYLLELTRDGKYFDELFANPESSVGQVLVEALGFERVQSDKRRKPVYYHLELREIHANGGIGRAMNLGCWWEKYRIKKRYEKHHKEKQL